MHEGWLPLLYVFRRSGGGGGVRRKIVVTLLHQKVYTLYVPVATQTSEYKCLFALSSLKACWCDLNSSPEILGLVVM